MKLKLNIVPICLGMFLPMFGLQAQTTDPQTTENTGTVDPTMPGRTVMSTEFGSIFAKPNGFPASEFGVYIGAGAASTSLSPGAIKGHYSRFHHFAPSDSSLGFPYAALRQYEAQQMAAGHPGIFVTATYQGKRRPVIDRGSLKLNSSNRPTASSENWVYPVNVRDQRFINFWITKYARPVVVQPMERLGHPYVYVDGVTLTYDTYGVLDNNDQFVAGVKWNEPFPQSGTDFQNAVAQFFTAVKEQASDIQIMVDTGSISDSNAFRTLYANVPGMLTENVYGWAPNPSESTVTKWYTSIFPWFQWAAASGKVNVMGAFLPSDESGPHLYPFAVYELLIGADSFLAPRVGGTALPLSAGWLSWNAKLGDPVGAYRSTQLGSGAGNRLFTRTYTNGYVYLNWTGRTQTVSLPSGTWYNPSGGRVTKISIPHGAGTFVNR